MPKSSEEKAVGYANANHTSLYKSAVRANLPRAFKVGWEVVKNIAHRVFDEGGTSRMIREEVMKFASEPIPPKKGDVLRLPSFEGKIPKWRV